jgi:phosphoglycolate phosphatase-like HAD superfamily hydrolase
MINVFLFDIDGTLLSSGGAGKAALEEGLADEFGISDTMEKLILSGRTDRAIVADLLVLSGLEDTHEHRQRLLTAYLRKLPGCLHRSRGKVLPGVTELLDQVSQRERTLVGLLTGNIHAGARIKLGHFNLWERFAFGGYGDEHLDRDDVARVAFTKAREHIKDNVDPQRVWVIGDTPHDIRCARAIGAKAVAVMTGWHSREELAACAPDVLLEDLRDARELIGQL